MLLIVMSTSELPEGWTDTNYKSFKTVDNSSESSLSDEEDSDDEEEDGDEKIKGYRKEKYKKLVFVEELLPE
jgi:hypothetical protein